MSHKKGFSRGVSVFEPVGLHHRNATPNFNICQPSTSKGITHSPWDNSRSGYSSTSPPGTASSGSSSNSQCYSRSPEDLSVDSLITSLLQVVSNESFATKRNSSSSNRDSFLPPNGAFGTSRCRGCSDPLCDSCLGMRQNRPGPSNLPDQFGALQSNSLDLPSSPMMRKASASVTPPLPNSPHLFCDMHRDVQRLFCKTCNNTLCPECEPHNHRGHVTIHLIEAVEYAGIQANKVMTDAQLGISSLRDDLANVQRAAEALEQKAQTATSDVINSIRRVASALEAREQELIGRIEKARMSKFNSLQARNEGIRNGIARLTQAVETLGDAMEKSARAGNPQDLVLTKDKISVEIFQIRQDHKKLPIPEENWISFTGPEGTVLHAVASFGTIIVNNPGSIGDRRAVRGRGSSPQAANQQPAPLPFVQLPRGNQPRPVPSKSFPVTMRNGRIALLSAPKPTAVFGNVGENREKLCRPWGVACDKEGHIVIADRSNNRLQIFREDGTFVRRFGTHGVGNGQFDRPAGVAVDNRRRIIVSDKDNHRIQILTMEGLFLLKFGEKGCRPGQFNYPWDVAVNAECQIVVSDTRNHRVQLFSPEGVFLRKYGYEASPTMWKHFDSPRGVAFNPDGNIVTTDFNNHRIIIIDADFLTARVLACDTTGSSKQFLRPQGLAVDDEGNIILADSRNHRVQVYSPTGALRWKFGSFGHEDDEMDRPSGVALSPSGKLVVVDFGNNRVLVV